MGCCFSFAASVWVFGLCDMGFGGCDCSVLVETWGKSVGLCLLCLFIHERSDAKPQPPPGQGLDGTKEL